MFEKVLEIQNSKKKSINFAVQGKFEFIATDVHRQI